MTHAATTEISVIMPCHNRDYDLRRVLEAYDQQSAPPGSFEIVAVDDASRDGTYALLAAFRPRRYSLKVLRLELNRGPGPARNEAIPETRSPLVLFVGDDILPQPAFITRHLQAHDRHPEREVAVLGKITWPEDMPRNTLMSHIDGVGAEQFSYYFLRDGEEYDFRHFYTSNLSLKKDMLSALPRWFDPEFRIAGFEDAELGYRLARKGLRIRYAAAIEARHYHYHTIWTFSRRQFYCGIMACLLSRKHLAAGRSIGLFFSRYLTLVRKPRFIRTGQDPISRDLETRVLRLASRFEWSTHPYLDWLYIKILTYFYNKGILVGLAGQGFLSQNMQHLYARIVLPQLIQWFTWKSENG